MKNNKYHELDLEFVQQHGGIEQEKEDIPPAATPKSIKERSDAVFKFFELLGLIPNKA